MKYDNDSDLDSKTTEFLSVIKTIRNEMEYELIYSEDSIIKIYSNWKRLEAIKIFQEEYMEFFGLNIPY